MRVEEHVLVGHAPAVRAALLSPDGPVIEPQFGRDQGLRRVDQDFGVPDMHGLAALLAVRAVPA